MRFWRHRDVPGAAGVEPAAAARPADSEHSSPGLAALFSAVGSVSGVRLLDLGAASPGKLELYSGFARSFRFLDLLRAGCDVPVEEALTALGDLVEPAFDAMLMWDLLDHTSAADAARLIERLAACARPGTRLFGMVSTTRTVPLHPIGFEPRGTDRLLLRAGTGGERPGPQLPPAEVERRLAPFRVERAFLLRHGYREHIAVRP